MDDEILTIRELGALLKTREKTAYTMAQTGDMLGFEVRDPCQFRRTDFDLWIDGQVNPPADAEQDE